MCVNAPHMLQAHNSKLFLFSLRNQACLAFSHSKKNSGLGSKRTLGLFNPFLVFCLLKKNCSLIAAFLLSCQWGEPVWGSSRLDMTGTSFLSQSCSMASDEPDGFDDFDSHVSVGDESLIVSGTQTKKSQSKTGRFRILARRQSVNALRIKGKVGKSHPHLHFFKFFLTFCESIFILLRGRRSLICIILLVMLNFLLKLLTAN